MASVLRECAVHLEDNFNTMLLFMLLHLIRQQHGEVGTSSSIPVIQVENQRMRDMLLTR